MNALRCPSRAATVRRGLLPLLLLPLLASCTFGQAPNPTPTPIIFVTPGVRADLAPTVYTVQRGAVVDALSFPAKVTLASVDDLFFAVPGRVKEIYVGSGATVEEGELLAELDTRILQFDLEAAELAVALARQRQVEGETDLRFEALRREADLQIEKLQLDALKQDKTSSPTAVAIQELAVRQADLALQQLEGGTGPELQAEVDRTAIALRKVQAGLEDARVVAPFGGQVLLFDALRKGKVVQAYEPVASIVDPEAIVLEANLVPADLEYLAEGMPVQITLSGPLPKTIPGVIRTLPQPFGTGAGAATTIVPAQGVVAGTLRPGLSAEIGVERGRNASALWLPPEAVQGYRDNYFVRLRDGTEAPVEVGIYGTERVEVKSGVREGMEVVGR